LRQQVNPGRFRPDWGTRRLERIWNELSRLVPRAPQPVVPGYESAASPSPAQPGNGAQISHFAHAAGRIDQIAHYLKTLLEQHELEVQVIDQGYVKIVQGRSPEQAGWADVLKTSFGLKQAVSIKLQAHGADLLLEIGNGAWMDKAVGGAVGMLVFWPAAITAGWGAYKQSELLKRIPLDVRRLLAAE
jgi:hypothetical protein